MLDALDLASIKICVGNDFLNKFYQLATGDSAFLWGNDSWIIPAQAPRTELFLDLKIDLK